MNHITVPFSVVWARNNVHGGVASARTWCLALAGTLCLCALRASAADSALGVRAELGQEMEKNRQDVLDARPEPTRKVPALGIEKPEPADDVEAGAGPAFTIQRIELSGDKDLLDSLGLEARLKEEIVGKRLTEKQIKTITLTYQGLLVEHGYYLARVIVLPQDFGKETLALRIDKGRIGKKTFLAKRGEAREPFSGRHYSLDQIEQRLADIQEGDAFLYGDFYRDFYRLNAHPDLTANVDLNVRKEKSGDFEQRYVDMTFEVEERLPLHAVLSLDNSGTDITDEWGGSLSVQHLNLTHRDDVLTVTAPVSLDLESIRSVAGSYYLPHRVFRGGNWTVFGGYSKIAATDIVPELSLDGKGWFAGVQANFTLAADSRREVSALVGISHSFIEDSLLLGGTDAMPREIELTPINLGLAWTGLKPDALRGRNSLQILGSVHHEEFPGASGDEEFSLQREGADPNYVKLRMQFGRLQPLFGEADQAWVLYTQLDGQIASSPLVPAELKPSSTRGYETREFLADQGVSGTLELRTPIMEHSWLSALFSAGGADRSGLARLQLSTFIDAAYLSQRDALPGEDDVQTLVSAGLGLRYSLGTHFQFRGDWGFPLKETDQSDTGGRGHLGAQLLF